MTKELNDIKELEVLAKDDEKLLREIEKKQEDLKDKIKKEEFRIFLSGKYDRGNAILEVQAGAGGIDAQDWASMLIRMFERYCAKKGFQVKILHQSFGEGGGPEGRIGTKSAILEIKGSYAYGFLKKESGVHRMVRISPFSAQKLRHTSFVLVEVLPEIEKTDEEEIKIKPEELKIETFRASGPGGQYLQKTESAVRITHLPTGIVVSCQAERLQGQNKRRAMEILYSKLYQLKEEEYRKEIKRIKDSSVLARPHTKRGLTSSVCPAKRDSPRSGVGASWGNQIRSYVLHPYKMVKDLRTQYETSDTESVLDGNLDEFIEAEIKS